MISDRFVSAIRNSRVPRTEWIIPREFHSSLITAVKNKFGPRLDQLPSRRSISSSVSVGAGLSTVPAILPPPSPRPPPTFSMPFSAGATGGAVCLLAVANGGLEKYSRPGRKSFCSPALYRYRVTIYTLKAKAMRRTSWGQAAAAGRTQRIRYCCLAQNYPCWIAKAKYSHFLSTSLQLRLDKVRARKLMSLT